MMQMPELFYTFGAQTLTLETTRRGPAITMNRDRMDAGDCREGVFMGGLVHYLRRDRRGEPIGRADAVALFIKDIVDDAHLVDVLTNPTAGLLVEAGDAAHDVAALRGWLRGAIKDGRDWLEAVA